MHKKKKRVINRRQLEKTLQKRRVTTVPRLIKTLEILGVAGINHDFNVMYFFVMMMNVCSTTPATLITADRFTMLAHFALLTTFSCELPTSADHPCLHNVKMQRQVESLL